MSRGSNNTNLNFKHSKYIYNYKAPWPTYGLHWSQRPGDFRLGFGSLVEDYNNKIQIVQLFDGNADFVKIAEADHHYPLTKFLWSPYKGGNVPDLFATSGDCLRIFELVNTDSSTNDGPSNRGDSDGNNINKNNNDNNAPIEGKFEIKCTASLSNIRRGQNKREFCAPLTSFDWNETNPSMIVTSSVDTTCTVWDVTTQKPKTQLIAHDKEVYDVAFARGTDVFASVGADGSVRMFDLRALEHSTIVYETAPALVPVVREETAGAGVVGGSGRKASSIPSTTTNTTTTTTTTNRPLHPAATAPPLPNTTPSASTTTMSFESPSLLRLAWNKQDPNYIATVQVASASVLILDVRFPAAPVVELVGHVGGVNAVGWAPHSSSHVCSVADDSQALVWDISSLSKSRKICEPLLTYNAGSEVNQMSWSSVNTDWVAIAFGDMIQALKV